MLLPYRIIGVGLGLSLVVFGNLLPVGDSNDGFGFFRENPGIYQYVAKTQCLIDDTLIPLLNDLPESTGILSSLVAFETQSASFYKEIHILPVLVANTPRIRVNNSDSLVFRILKLGYDGKAVEAYLLVKIDSAELSFEPINLENRLLITNKGLYLFTGKSYLEATAYYPGSECTSPSADGLTCTGQRAGYGVVAVDPSVIPLGTRLYIKGYGFAVAADVGGAIKGERIDLCFNTYQEALNYGRRKVWVFRLE